MLSDIYAESRKWVNYAECLYAECRGTHMAAAVLFVFGAKIESKLVKKMPPNAENDTKANIPKICFYFTQLKYLLPPVANIIKLYLSVIYGFL